MNPICIQRKNTFATETTESFTTWRKWWNGTLGATTENNNNNMYHRTFELEMRQCFSFEPISQNLHSSIHIQMRPFNAIRYDFDWIWSKLCDFRIVCLQSFVWWMISSVCHRTMYHRLGKTVPGVFSFFWILFREILGWE